MGDEIELTMIMMAPRVQEIFHSYNIKDHMHVINYYFLACNKHVNICDKKTRF